MNKMNLSAVYRKRDNFVEKQVGNELVLVPLTDNVADMNSVFTLNEVGTFIYNCLDGIKTLGEILDEILEAYEIDAETAQVDLRSFIHISISKKVIEEQV